MTIIYIKKKKRINRGYIGDFPNSCYLMVIRHKFGIDPHHLLPDTSTVFYQVLLVEKVFGGSCIGAKLNKGFLGVNARRP